MALLACLRSYWQIGGAAQESIGKAAKVEQVIERADEQRSLWRAGGSLEIRPVGRDQRLTAVWQDKHELQAGGHAGLPQNLQRLSMERMMQTRDGHAFGEELMVGSVWCFPSTKSNTVGWSSSWSIGSETSGLSA
jgi:hypothetical protein